MQRLTAWSAYIGALGVALIVATFLLGLFGGIQRNILLLVAGIGIILIGFYIITRPRDQVRDASLGRTAIQGTNVIVAAIATIGILLAINYIADNQFDQRLDVTANKAHTLSQQTISVLQSLKSPVQVTGFFNPQTASQKNDAQNLLNDYVRQTSQLTVTYVDPDQNPTLSQKYDNALPGTLVFEAVGAKPPRTEKVYTFDENSMTNAILKVTQTQQPAIYFSTGHGEFATDSTDQNGLSAIVDYLKQVNYKVQPLNLTTISNTVPADTSAIVLAGPTKKFSADDEKILRNYMNNGGRILLLFDVNTDPGLSDLLKDWGLTLNNDLVLDPSQNYRGNAPIPVFGTFPNSPVTQDLAQLGVYLPGARSIKSASVQTETPTALLTTTGDACAKTDLAKLQQQQQQQIQCEAGDGKGPFVVGYSVESTAPSGNNPNHPARLVIFGNASFATNGFMNNQDALGNQQMFGNAINWLAGQEQLIAIPARDPNLRPLSTLSGADINLIQWSSVALIPLAALAIGGILWWRRR